MKKILSIILFAGLLFGGISCKGSGASDASGKDSTATATANRSTTAMEDSLSEKYGYFSGAGLIASIQQNPALKDIDKEQVLKAFETILALDTTKQDRSYAEALGMALRLYGELLTVEGQGVNINRQLILKNFKEAFNSKDEFDVVKLQSMQGELSSIMEKIQNDKSQENLAAGKKYIKEKMEKDKNFKKLDSGIIYKIVEPGNGETFKESSAVDITYLCKDINDKVILDMTSNPIHAQIAQMKQDPIFSKLQDIIKTMKPGAKVVAVIPGDQLPTEQIGIGPNKTLVFEITTATPQGTSAQPAAPVQPK